MTALRALVDPGDLVYDVGANIGLYARLLVHELDASTVIAFEPWEKNRRSFLLNARLGGIEKRIKLLPYAIADFDNQAAFQVDDVQSTSGTLDVAHPGAASTGRSNIGLPPLLTTVNCRTLDSLLADGLDRPQVLKIDVEGSEDLVLRGARRLLETDRPSLLIELHGGDVARRVLAAVLGHGYTCRGFGASTFLPAGYGCLDASFISTIRGFYDLHFLVASHDANRITKLDALQLSSR
jgi:FkbM family methyltransferase